MGYSYARKIVLIYKEMGYLYKETGFSYKELNYLYESFIQGTELFIEETSYSYMINDSNAYENHSHLYE